VDQRNHGIGAYAVSIDGEMNSRRKECGSGLSERNNWTMPHTTNKPVPKVRGVPQPPLSYPGATPDSERAKKPPLTEPSATGEELSPGDRVEGSGNFGKLMGEFGIVEQANEEDAIVKWDGTVV